MHVRCILSERALQGGFESDGLLNLWLMGNRTCSLRRARLSPLQETPLPGFLQRTFLFEVSIYSIKSISLFLC